MKHQTTKYSKMKIKKIRWLNAVGVILIGLGAYQIIIPNKIFIGVLLISIGYFLYLKND